MMELVAWSIAVVTAIVLVVVAFCVLCGIAAEEKGRSLWWAVMGLFNIFGLIAVLLLDRTVASEVNRRVAIERTRAGSLSSGGPRPSAGSRGESPRHHRQGTSGASRTQNPVGAWLSERGATSDALPSGYPLKQEPPESTRSSVQQRRSGSPLDSFLNSEAHPGAEDSRKET